MLYLLLSKASGSFGHFLDEMTGGLGYAHGAIYDPDRQMMWESHICHPSLNKGGVRWIDRTPADNEELYAFPGLTPEIERDIRKRMDLVTGDDYDSVAALGVKLPFLGNAPHKEYCTEAVCMVVQPEYFPGEVACKFVPNRARVVTAGWERVDPAHLEAYPLPPFGSTT